MVRLASAAGLNGSFAVVQVTVGLVLGSVVVLADALHQVTDAVGLITALVAVALARRPPSSTMSFGWGKADALGGYTSALLLLASLAWVVVEALDRLGDPVEVSGAGVVAIGAVGIVVNAVGVVLVGHGHQLSVRAARLHLLVDLAASVIVVLSGLLLIGTSWDWIDPVASLVVNVLVLRGALALVRSASAELLDRAPAGADPPSVRRVLLSRPGVTEVHHVHSRVLAPGVTSVTAHVVVDGALSVHDAQAEVESLQAALGERLGIEHATIQLECHECEDVDHR